MHQFRRFTQLTLNVLATGYVLALTGLLILRLIGHDHRWWIAFLINFMPIFFVPLWGFIALALLLRTRPALLATAPLALVGLVLYGPLFLVKPAAAVSGKPVNIITFNVSDTNSQRDDVFGWLRAQHADVVLLQEVSADWFVPARQILNDLYPQQTVQLTEAGNRGNLILSHFPLTAVPDANSSPFAPAVLSVDGQPTAFYNISLVTPVDASPHHELPFEYPFLDLVMRYDDQFRNHQIALLLEQVQAQTLPYIVAGDFNMSDQTSVYASLAAQMDDSFREGGIGLGASWPAFKVAGLAFLPPLIRIDYIWHSRRGFTTLNATVGPFLGSDHLPVETTLAFVSAMAQ